jgi:hypothetical protein
MFRRTGGGVIEVRAEPRPVTEPYMASEAEGPAAVSGGRDSAGDCGRDSGLGQDININKCRKLITTNRLRIRIPDPVPGFAVGKKIRIRSRDEPQPESLETIFWVKLLKSLMRIRDGKNSDPGWNKFGSGLNIPDPQYCNRVRKLAIFYRYLRYFSKLVPYAYQLL